MELQPPSHLPDAPVGGYAEILAKIQAIEEHNAKMSAKMQTIEEQNIKMLAKMQAIKEEKNSYKTTL